MEEENKINPEEENFDELSENPRNEEVENVKEVKTRVKRETKITRVEKNKKKKNKKKIIIISIIGVILIASIIAILLLGGNKEKTKKEKAFKEKWGEIYYEYLKDVKEDNADKAGLPETMEDAKINFYDVDTVDPIMAISYELNDDEYTNIYFINDNKVDAIVYNEPTDIELLYNIENKDYNYYTESSKDNTDTYKTIKDQIRQKLNSENGNITEYTFKDDEKDTVKDVNGNEISLTKFEQTFIEVEIEDDGISYKTNLTEKALKKVVDKSVKNYKEVEEILTENIKKSTQTKEEGILKKQEEMKTAKDEVIQKEASEKAKKEAEEKAKKEAEEKAKNAGLTVGSYTLKYGTYKGVDADEGNTFVLKQNGQCTYNGAACTYTLGKHDYAQDESSHLVKDSLVIKTQYTLYLYPYSSTEIGDGDIGRFVYSG